MDSYCESNFVINFSRTDVFITLIVCMSYIIEICMCVYYLFVYLLFVFTICIYYLYLLSITYITIILFWISL